MQRVRKLGLLAMSVALLGSACVRNPSSDSPDWSSGQVSSTSTANEAADTKSTPKPNGALRVRSAGGQALAGAHVCVLSGPNLELERCTETGADGSTTQPVTQYDADARLAIAAADHCGRQVFAFEEIVELERCSTHAVGGRVVDGDGQPVAGAKLRVQDQTQSIAWAISDSRGEFQLEVDSYSPLVSLRAHAPSHAPTWQTTLLPANAVELALLPESSLAGIVVDEAGAPIAGAAVATEIGLAEILDGRVTPEHTRTDSLGQFELGGLGASNYRIHVDGSRWHSQLEQLQLGPGEARRDLRLVARRGNLLRVALRDSHGQPCRSGRVRITSLGRSGVAERGGWWAFADLPKGRHLVDARCEGSRRASEVVDVPGDPTLTLTSERGAFVAGVVLDQAGLPVPGATVTAVSSDNHEGTRTNGAGQFELRGLEPGLVRLDVTALGILVERRPELALGPNAQLEDLELRADRGVCLRGELRSSEAVAVKVYDADGTIDLARPDERGRFRACGLRPGQAIALAVVSGTLEQIAVSTGAGARVDELQITIPAQAEPAPLELRVGPLTQPN